MLTALARNTLLRRELARLCQQAEKEFVGVHGGIMDQFASLLCTEGHALYLDYASLEAEAVPLALEAARLADAAGGGYPGEAWPGRHRL